MAVKTLSFCRKIDHSAEKIVGALEALIFIRFGYAGMSSRRNLLVAVICCLPFLICAVETPLRDVSKIGTQAATKIIRINHARVVLADYSLIRRDFNEVGGFSDRQIDLWLLEHGGYISLNQAKQSVVNTPIPETGFESSAIRLLDYRRALIFRTSGGLIDGKGVGSEDPRQADHQNGLATLGEMVREFAYEKLVQKIFDHSGSGLRTVGCYAVLDLGLM